MEENKRFYVVDERKFPGATPRYMINGSNTADLSHAGRFSSVAAAFGWIADRYHASEDMAVSYLPTVVLVEQYVVPGEWKKIAPERELRIVFGRSLTPIYVKQDTEQEEHYQWQEREPDQVKYRIISTLVYTWKLGNE